MESVTISFGVGERCWVFIRRWWVVRRRTLFADGFRGWSSLKVLRRRSWNLQSVRRTSLKRIAISCGKESRKIPSVLGVEFARTSECPSKARFCPKARNGQPRIGSERASSQTEFEVGRNGPKRVGNYKLPELFGGLMGVFLGNKIASEIR